METRTKKNKKFKVIITGEILNATYTKKRPPSVKFLKHLKKIGSHKIIIIHL